MKKLGLLIMPLMAIPFLVSCGDNGITITWKNYDGTILEEDKNVKKGDMPCYDGDTPTRHYDDNYYFFTGWNPEITEVTKSQVYTAQYRAVDIKGVDMYMKLVIPEDAENLKFSFDYELESGKELVVDWGDGSNSETSTYEYNQPGEYEVRIKNITDFAIGYDGAEFIKEVYYISDKFTKISQDAFSNCESLTSINLPDSISSIGNYAFYGCHSLESITIPKNVNSIGIATFEDCSSLSSIKIPSSVILIGSEAFSACSSLSSIEVDPNNPNYDSRENCNAIITKKQVGQLSANTLLRGSINTTIPDSVIAIDEFAFDFLPIDSLTIPNGVTSIGDYAFWYCTSLSSINLPDSITSIGAKAFYRCSSLAISFSIPNGVNEIKDRSFFGSAITEIIIPNSVTHFGDDVFGDCFNLSVIDLTSYTDEGTIPTSELNAFAGLITNPTFEVASYNMAYAFSIKGGGWPDNLNKYNWPGKAY